MADVSKATVSAVINNRPGVSSVTRDKVLSVIRKLNYRPNSVARSLSLRATKSVGLVIKEIDNPFFAKIMKGVFDKCSEHGYTVLLGSSEQSPDAEVQSVETLTNQRVDGLILSPLQSEQPDFSHLAHLLTRKFPMVTLGEIKNYPTNIVDTDNLQAAFQAVKYLLDLGHMSVAYFAGPSFSGHSRDRMTGYQQALSDYKLSVSVDNVVSCGAYFENGYEKGREVFSNSNHPTAVLCYNDLVALGLVQALGDLGIAVPDDVAVIGFDDIDFSRYARIPLTTVHVPAYEMGAKAAELLIGQLENRDEVSVRKILLDTRLIKRQSA